MNIFRIFQFPHLRSLWHAIYHVRLLKLLELIRPGKPQNCTSNHHKVEQEQSNWYHDSRRALRSWKPVTFCPSQVNIEVLLEKNTVANTCPGLVRIGNGDIEMAKQLDRSSRQSSESSGYHFMKHTSNIILFNSIMAIGIPRHLVEPWPKTSSRV